jgi:hypothetical protein
MVNYHQRTPPLRRLLRRMHPTRHLHSISHRDGIIDLLYPRRTPEVIAHARSARGEMFPHGLHVREIMEFPEGTDGFQSLYDYTSSVWLSEYRGI